MYKFIENLKRSDHKRKQALLLGMQQKNVAFFKTTNPELAKFIEMHGTGSFEIRVTDTSVEVLDRAGEKLYHPPGEMLQYMSELGAWHHTGWVDKQLMQHVWRGGEHGQIIVDFLNKLYAENPFLRTHMDQGVVSLPKLKDGRRYSGPVVFLGVFIGLHILYYLSRTEARDVFLIEPDLDRFALSCFFVDYENIQNKLGRLMLHVGPDAPQQPIDALTVREPITASVWVRLLPAYEDGKFDEIINRVNLRWRGLTEIFVPYDREVRNLQYAVRNIQNKLPLLHQPPQLSENSIIAVVASGPSLNQDMEWLRENQGRMVVMSSISSVRVLRENGIRVDFQCTLDTEIDDKLFNQLQMDTDVPLVAYYKIDPELAKRFKQVYLLPETYKANAVHFLNTFSLTHPTTGNLITAFASWCKPATLLFIGLDLGFRSAKQSHVKGGWHDEDEGVGHDEETAGRDHVQVAANFPESEGEILSLSYYNNARFIIEDAVQGVKDASRVLNLADGARIEGAAPMRSTELSLPDYPEKAADVERMKKAFSTEYAEIWKPYEVTGKELMAEVTDNLIKELTLDGEFNWPEWSRAIDVAWNNTVTVCTQKYNEWRIEVYVKLIYDLLSEWYRSMIVTENPDEANEVYNSGLRELRAIMEKLPWPEELDALGKDPAYGTAGSKAAKSRKKKKPEQGGKQNPAKVL